MATVQEDGGLSEAEKRRIHEEERERIFAKAKLMQEVAESQRDAARASRKSRVRVYLYGFWGLVVLLLVVFAISSR